MDRATRAVMEAMDAAFPRAETVGVHETRAALRAQALSRPPRGRAAEVTAEDRKLDGPGGALPVRVYRPPGGDRGDLPGVVYFHGGGFVICDLDTHDASVRALCLATGAVVVSVDYRLAPEHPFPAAVEDCLAAVQTVVHDAGSFGVDPGRVAVAGDSAGGNLAAVVALLAAGEGIRLVHQLLIYPALDPTGAGPSHAENAEGFFLTESSMRWYWLQYLGGRDLLDDPRVAPGRAASLAGVAPATVVVAEYDPLRSDGEQYAAALAAAGVPVDLQVAEGMFHGFAGVSEILPAAGAYCDAAYAVLRAACFPAR